MEEICVNSLHTYKLKVVRRYVIDMFKIVIMINLGTLKNQKLCKNCTKKTKNTPQGCKRRFEEMERRISFLAR